MMTRNPQWSDWSLEEGNIVEHQNSSNKYKTNSVIPNNNLMDINKDESTVNQKSK